MTNLHEILKALKNAPQLEDIDQAILDLENFLNVCDNLPTPLFNLIIVKQIEATQEKSGLVIPMNEKLNFGIVIKKGSEVKGLKEGDRIGWFSVDNGEEMEFSDEMFMVMNAPEKVLVL